MDRSPYLLLLVVFTSGVLFGFVEEPPSSDRADSLDWFYSPDRLSVSDDIPPSLSPVYAHLRSTDVGNSNLPVIQSHASDELMVPTRGPDWGDGGIWRDLTQHNWASDHPMFSDAWTDLFQGVHRSNAAIKGLTGAVNRGMSSAVQYRAEARFLRAYFYWQLVDLFGGVPLATTPSESRAVIFPGEESVFPSRETRPKIFNFLLQELTGCSADSFTVESCITSPASGAIVNNLPVRGEVSSDRATVGAAYALVSTLLLNAEVYTGDVSASGVAEGMAFYKGAAAAADQVINNGRYALESNYFDNFAAENSNSREAIFSVPYEARRPLGNEPQPGNVRPMPVLHYNHPGGVTPWNGFTTIAEFYQSYNTEPGSDGVIGTGDDVHADVRGKSFLVGNQYQSPSQGCFGDNCFSDESSVPITVRGENTQLRHTLEIPSIRLGTASPPPDFPNSQTFLLEAPGARPLKYEIDPNRAGRFMGNDVPIFRLAEMYLNKAEAENELGNRTEALDALNEIHVRAGNKTYSAEAVPSTLRMHQLILQERGKELLYENRRRTDLIRYEFAHGGTPVGPPYTSAEDPYAPTFTAPWLFKKDGSQNGQASEPFRILFPIPEEQILGNPNLTQNPGY